MKKLFVKCMNLLCTFSKQCKIKKRLIAFVKNKKYLVFISSPRCFVNYSTFIVFLSADSQTRNVCSSVFKPLTSNIKRAVGERETRIFGLFSQGRSDESGVKAALWLSLQRVRSDISITQALKYTIDSWSQSERERRTVIGGSKPGAVEKIEKHSHREARTQSSRNRYSSSAFTK